MQWYGISGNLHELLKDYLSYRKLRVLLNGKNSEWADMLAGVPQGSVLGPPLFLVYINDLVESVGYESKLFADDTSLYSVVYGESKTAEEVNRDLETVLIWVWQWKMKFNTEKTEEIIFFVKEVKPLHSPLSFGNDHVARMSEHMHLGMNRVCLAYVLVCLARCLGSNIQALCQTASRLWGYCLS